MPMSDEHKAALAQGRAESRAVKAYLAALGARRPGRPVTKESLSKKVADLTDRIESEGNPLNRLEMIQARLDAEERMAELDDAVDVEELEREFAAVAKSYSDRKGISYMAWREAGVSAATLKEAGVPRTRRS